MARNYMPGPVAQGYKFYNYLKDTDWSRVARQAAAGAHELVTADVDPTAGSYMPALIPQVTSIPAVIKQFTTEGGKRVAKGKGPFSGDNAVEQYLNKSFKQIQEAEKQGSELAGVTGPQNITEFAARYGPLGLIRGPLGLLSTASKAGKVGKAVAAAGKAVERVPKYITKPAKAAVELATPFRQTKLKTAVPLQAAVTGVMDVMMDKGTNSEGEEYTGTIPRIIRNLSGREEESAATPEEEAELLELDQQMLNEAYEAGEITDEEVDEYINAPPSAQEEDAVTHSAGIEKAKDAALWVGATLAATIGGRKFSRVAGEHAAARLKAIDDPSNMGKFEDPELYGENAAIDVNADVPPPSAVPDKKTLTDTGQEPEYIGTKYEKSDSSAMDRAIGGAFEKTRPIVDNARRFLGRHQAKKMGFQLDALTNSSIQARFVDWLKTGRAPKSEMKTESLQAWSRTFAKELDGSEQNRVGDALVAASSLDDFRNTGQHASLFKDRNGNPVNIRQMEQLVDSVKQDPKLGKYFQQVQKFYDEKLRYEVERGLLTQADYDEMRKKRPNYVPLRGNLQQEAPYSPFGMRYSANEDVKAARSLETETGLPGNEGVVNPMASLFEDWSDTIRRAETNNFRSDFLEKMANAGARNSKGELIVRKLKPNAAGRNVHEVNTSNGVVKYDVLDSQLAKSLHLSPRDTAKGFEEARQLYQNMTTGALATGRNLFGVIAAPIMDSMAASTLAGKSHGVGLANRLFAGGHIGGVRAAGDMIAGEFASRMRSHMIRENSWMKNVFGEKGMEKFTTMLENHYKNTTLADMDQMGITSKSAWGSQDPTHVMEGIEGVVPEYARQQSQRVIDEINTALDNGDIGKVRAAASKVGNRWTQAKTLPIARQYGALLEAMHNGARYQAVRANKGKVKDLDEFISDMRRLSADPAQHGSNKWINYAASSNLYGPISMATLAQIGKRAREDPLNFARNTTQTGMTAAAMFYLGQYYDEEAREKHKAKTPQQRASKLTMFGGAELPLDQIQRLLLGSVMPVTDQISGMNSGEWNENFMDSMRKMIEGEGPPMDEAAMKEWEMRFNEAVRANMPSSLLSVGVNAKPDGSVGMKYTGDASSIPPLAAIQALAGMDPGMSTLTGEVVGPKTQKISGFEPGEDRPGSLTGSMEETLIRTLFSSAGAGIYDVGDDIHRLLNDKDPNNKKTVSELALDQWKEGAQKGAGPLKGVLFGDRVEQKSAADVNYALLKDREKGIENALNVYERNLRTDTHTGASTAARSKGISRELDPSGTAGRLDITGTEAARIGASAKQVTSELAATKKEITQISQVIESVKASTNKTQSEKSAIINKHADEIRYKRMNMLRVVREHERLLTKKLGKDFSFEDYNPEDWLQPYVRAQE